MKVFQINSTCSWGSTGRIAAQIYEVLKENGDECKIAFGRGTAPENINSYKIGSETGVKIHGVLSRITDRSGFYSTGATHSLIDEIKKFDPDIIHLHNIHGYYLNVKTLFEFLKEYNKPIVWTLHDCWAFTGHCAYFDFAKCEKWKSGCFDCPQKGTYPASVFMDNSEKNYNEKKRLFTSPEKIHFVTPSNWLAELTKQSYLGKYPVSVIYNGIDLNKFKPIQSDFKKKNNIDKKMVLGVASIWEERKGLADFIKLSENLPEDYKIVLVGLSKGQIASLPDGVLGIERTNSVEELAQIYSAADVFVNPTYEDNFPTTNIEALACGTPVITYKTGGSAEAITEKCGTAVPKGDVQTLMKAVCEMSFNRTDCTERSKFFDSSLKYREYCALYKQIAEG